MSKKIDEWRGIIADCKKSGVSQREYCIEQELSFPTFSYWRTKIDKLDSPANTDVSAPFVRRSLPLMNSTAFVLEWPDGMRLKMPNHLRAEDVTNLVSNLRRALS